MQETLKSLYLQEKDIEFLVDNGDMFSNPNYGKFIDDVFDSITLDKFHTNNPVEDKKQWIKVCFDFMMNYNKSLTISPKTLAEVCFKIFYGEDTPDANVQGKRYSTRDARIEIGNIKL